jgi:hypothetical protein
MVHDLGHTESDTCHFVPAGDLCFFHTTSYSSSERELRGCLRDVRFVYVHNNDNFLNVILFSPSTLYSGDQITC